MGPREAWLVEREDRKGTREQEGRGRQRLGWPQEEADGGARTLAEMPEEHVEEGDVDGAVGSSVVFNLAQHHLQPGHGEKGCGERKGPCSRDTEIHVEKESRGDRALSPFLQNPGRTEPRGARAGQQGPRSATTRAKEGQREAPPPPPTSLSLDLRAAHLNAARQDAGGKVTVELGVLLTFCHQVPQLTGQQQLSRVLLQDLGEGVFGSQAAEHHCVVLVRGGQAIQEAQ